MEKNISRAVPEKIYLIRGHRVMLDRDLASLYDVETKVLNQSVRRNALRFPADFCFVLTNQEVTNLKSQIVTSSLGEWGGRRKPPIAFTEQGVAMLSSVLKSERAILVNVAIIRTFVRLRQVLAENKDLSRRLDDLEKKYDSQFKAVFDAIRRMMVVPEGPRRRIGF